MSMLSMCRVLGRGSPMCKWFRAKVLTALSVHLSLSRCLAYRSSPPLPTPSTATPCASPPPIVSDSTCRFFLLRDLPEVGGKKTPSQTCTLRHWLHSRKHEMIDDLLLAKLRITCHDHAQLWHTHTHTKREREEEEEAQTSRSLPKPLLF